MILGGYLEQVSEFSNFVERSNRDFVIYNDANSLQPINQQALEQVEQILNSSSSVQYYIPMYSTFGKVQLNHTSYEIQLLIANVSNLVDTSQILIPNSNTSDSLYIDPELGLPVVQSDIQYQVSYDNQNQFYNGSTEVAILGRLAFDVLISASTLHTDGGSYHTWNAIRIRLSNDANSRDLHHQLDNIDGIVFEENRSDKMFLLTSSRQIANLLLVFQFMMSILLILSIAYVMIALIQDSSNDIRLMKVIGLTNRGVWFVFIGQAVLVGIFASIFSFFTSILFLNFLFSALSLLPQLPYSTILVELRIILISTIQSILVSLIAGVYATYKVIS